MDTTALTPPIRMGHPQVDLAILMAPIERANLSQATKTKYLRAITRFIDAGGDITDPLSMAEHARALPQSGRAFLKSAVKYLTEGAALAAKSQATPENVNTIQAALYRIEALQEAVKVKASSGIKAHTWLSQAQVRALMATCADNLEGLRDWIVLGLLVGAGLRREELVNLRFDDLTEVPRNGNGSGEREFAQRPVLAVTGKGAKARVIPIKPILAERLREWGEKVGGGLVARSLGRKRVIGESLSAVGVFGIVRKHGAMIGKLDLDPHDMRRSYAQLGYEAGVPLTQITRLLGHSSVATTQRYLNLDLDLETTVSDFIPLD